MRERGERGCLTEEKASGTGGVAGVGGGGGGAVERGWKVTCPGGVGGEEGGLFFSTESPGGRGEGEEKGEGWEGKAGGWRGW